MRRYGIIFMIAVGMTLLSCSEVKQSDSEQAESNGRESTLMSEVTTIPVEVQTFSYDLVSNGKVGAGEYADLRFASTGAVVDRVLVKNGQRVSKGQTLATLDKFKLENAGATSMNALEKSRLDLADALIVSCLPFQSPYIKS